MKEEQLEKCILCESPIIHKIDEQNNICVCRNCGLILHNPRPTLEELVGFYSQPTKYDGWLMQEAGRDIMWGRRIGKIMNHAKGGTLLDIGTGIGQFLDCAKPYFVTVSGTEVSKSAIQIAKEKYDLEVTEGTIEDISLGMGTFDVVTAFHVLEHVPNPGMFIKKCYDLLNDKGILILAVPNEIHSFKRYIKTSLRLLRFTKNDRVGKYGLQKIKLDGSMGEIHLIHLTERCLVEHLNKSGFEVKEVSLDPYNPAIGLKGKIHYIYYMICGWISQIFSINVYDTILLWLKRNVNCVLPIF